MRSSPRTSGPGNSSWKAHGHGSETPTSTRRRWPPVSPRKRFSTTPREPERARRVLSKLRQVPRLIQAARENVKEPPAIFIKVGLDTLRGVMSFIDADLPRAFHTVDDLHLLADLADASTEAVQAVGSYVDYLETELRPRAKASFRLGRDAFEQKLRLEEGISLPTDRLLAIAERELHATQEEFRTLAGRLNGGDPIESWRKAKQQTHPQPGQLLATAREQLNELQTFLQRNSIVTLPADATSKWRRRRTSSAGRSPACGLRVRSRRAHRARCTT